MDSRGTGSGSRGGDEQRPPRKSYRLTPAGEAALDGAGKRYPLLAKLIPSAPIGGDVSRAWLQEGILRGALLLVPAGQRREWMADWRSELWYIPGRERTPFCLGAFRDAWWLRRNQSTRAAFLESPGGCLAFLAGAGGIEQPGFGLASGSQRDPGRASEVAGPAGGLGRNADLC